MILSTVSDAFVLEAPSSSSSYGSVRSRAFPRCRRRRRLPSFARAPSPSSRTRVAAGGGGGSKTTRYGPPVGPEGSPPEDDDNNEDAKQPQSRRPRNNGDGSSGAERRSQQLQVQFRKLVDDVVRSKDPERHLPSLLSKNIEFILEVLEYDRSRPESDDDDDNGGILQSIGPDNNKDEEQVEDAIDAIVSFAEDFVREASGLEEANRKLLGKIITAISGGDAGTTSAREREEALDRLFDEERRHLTPGFIRHVEGECERIASAPTMTPDSSRLLELLRIVQARVLEEVAGVDLGEAAQVLGQLVGYEDASERLAVLEAGLTVRGPDFARELLSLSDEALEGFTRVPAATVDPDLVLCVTEIRTRLVRYLDGSEDADEPGFQ